MMLLSVNKQQQTISLLSIPRDLYVQIPGYGRDRINTAFVHGAEGDNAAAGAAAVMQTVEQALGVPVDHYVLVNFRAVEKTIDALGGIDLYIPYTIDDPTYIDRTTGVALYIPEGLNHLDGATALRYVRTRHQDNDFFRAQRQQQLLLALREHVLSLGLADLISRAPILYQQIKSGVFTDLSLEDMVYLAQTGSDIPSENIKTAVLNGDYTNSTLSKEGSYVLLLIPEKVTPLIQEMFLSQTSPEAMSHKKASRKGYFREALVVYCSLPTICIRSAHRYALFAPWCHFHRLLLEVRAGGIPFKTFQSALGDVCT
jgi:LCP family protein required for cell wall assembly